MFCREYAPSLPLIPYIKTFILIEDEDCSLCDQVMNIYPSGHLEMIISFGDSVDFSMDNFRLKSGSGYLGGQILAPVFYRCRGRLRILSVIFRPYGIYRFLDIPQEEFNGRRIGLDLIMGSDGREFISRLCDEPDCDRKATLADSFFIKLLLRRDLKSPGIARASAFINQHYRNASIKEISGILNVNIKTLERDFRRIVGITPKELSRVLRFNDAFNRINSGEFTDLQDLVFDCGYYDQAHMINEFRRFTSRPPSVFIKDRDENIELSFREIVKI